MHGPAGCSGPSYQGFWSKFFDHFGGNFVGSKEARAWTLDPHWPSYQPPYRSFWIASKKTSLKTQSLPCEVAFAKRPNMLEPSFIGRRVSSLHHLEKIFAHHAFAHLHDLFVTFFISLWFPFLFLFRDPGSGRGSPNKKHSSHICTYHWVSGKKHIRKERVNLAYLWMLSSVARMRFLQKPQEPWEDKGCPCTSSALAQKIPHGAYLFKHNWGDEWIIERFLGIKSG